MPLFSKKSKVIGSSLVKAVDLSRHRGDKEKLFHLLNVLFIVHISKNRILKSNTSPIPSICQSHVLCLTSYVSRLKSHPPKLNPKLLPKMDPFFLYIEIGNAYTE